MEMGREEWRKVDKLTATLERVAISLEKAVELAQEEAEFEPFDPSPPACPACSEENPLVVFDMPSGRGRLAEFALAVRCESCGATIHGLPTEMILSNSIEEIREIQKQRKAGWK